MSTFNTDIYQEEITQITKSIISGEHTQKYRYDNPDLQKLPIIKAWLDDNDIQAVRVVSTNIGFIREFLKHYRQEGK